MDLGLPFGCVYVSGCRFVGSASMVLKIYHRVLGYKKL